MHRRVTQPAPIAGPLAVRSVRHPIVKSLYMNEIKNTSHVMIILLVILFSCKKEDKPEIITDSDGNIYTSITIGSQVWLKENLKTTKYNNGAKIPGITDPLKWETAYKPMYCWYDNDSTVNKSAYGALYNLFAVNSTKLCPVGWHVPDNNEWTTLLNFLGNKATAGNELKETGDSHWLTSNASVTNSTGFSALPGGLRGLDGSFLSKSRYGYWWSSSNSTDLGYTNCFTYENGNVYRFYQPGILGASVRCIKDL